ncbi:hypothetical protein PSCLAVI8L_130511 [Pseudoclavibacter sp. 8L]|nr:hypothetical protein PSCLAVI8L_130511 [Pseudoclavibacter sp. 8L]
MVVIYHFWDRVHLCEWWAYCLSLAESLRSETPAMCGGFVV